MFADSDPAGLRRGRIRYLPVAPGRMEFAEQVRQQILEHQPGVVAVELPVTLRSCFERAVDRLPELSIIIYEDESSDRAVYVPVEVTDPFVEAIRTARETGAEVVFLDPDTGERPHVEDFYPDPYAVRRVGYDKYVERYRLFPRPPSKTLYAYAEGMAWKLQGANPEAPVLAVVSLNLLEPLLEAMERPQAQPLRKVRRKGLRVLNLHPESLAEVLTDIPFLQAVYEARRKDEPPAAPAQQPAVRQVRGFGVVAAPKEEPRAAAVARTARHELDRQRIYFRIFAETEKQYRNETGETLSHWQRRLWARFTRNLALVEKQLVAGLFDMTVAARSVVDDNFAWEFWEMANAYPAQKTETDLATVKVSGEEMWLDTRRIRLRRRRPRQKGRLKPIGLKGRKKERYPGEWAREWRGDAICSYPPEDLVIEDYGVFLKKKGKSVLSEERSRVEPFTTSLLDGIDLRETLRHWHEKKIFVRANQKVAGEVGAVVLIFDAQHDDRYPYCITWLGEHQNESDMAFYATNPFERLVGPGIGRGEYGGLMMTLPPRRLMDVWSDPDYVFAESKAERLLLAALDYSCERIVVYAAAKPPRSIFRTIAGRLGRKIVYIPIRTLSPLALKKIRVMHVLDSHSRRAVAKDHIR